jgi:hypothetical protein
LSLSRGGPVINRIPVAGAAVVVAAAAFLLLAVAPRADAATPTIVNTASVGGQTTWLESFATTGEDGDAAGAKRIRLTVLVKHDLGRSAVGLRIDQDWGATDETGSIPTTTAGVDVQQPTVAGGFGYTRLTYTFTPANNPGITSSTRRITKPLRIRAVLDNGDTTASSSSDVKFTSAAQDGTFGGTADYPYMKNWTTSGGNFDRTVNSGGTLNFTYVCDDPDTNFFSSDDDCAGVKYRTRNVLTGATTTAQVDCPDGSDNSTKSTDVSFPTKGRFVVEAEFLNENSCSGDGPNSGAWFPIGTVNVNDPTVGNPTLTATRPQLNGNTTLTLDLPADDGKFEYVEWDFDGNTTNGVSGFETSDQTDPQVGLADPYVRTLNTATMTPGTHTVRARVTDNGAMAGADDQRHTSGIVTASYLVDSPPNTSNQTVTTESNQNKPITLVATDADSDSLTYSITGGNHLAHGWLCPANNPVAGCANTSGPGRVYVPDGNYAGDDSFSYQVSDGWGGTDTATVTINVTPQTQIDDHPDATSGSNTATFEFSSPAASQAPNPPVTFECRLDSTLPTDFQPCFSPKVYLGLSDGAHTFDVRAKVGNTYVDPTPASFSWTVDATLPDTTIDTGPSDPTKLDTAAFTFHSDDPMATFTCRLDTAGFQPCGTQPKTYTGLSEGEHTFQVRATDAFNRTDPIPASYTWHVDLTAPTATIDSAPANPTNQTQATFEFSSTDLSATFQCRLDSSLEAAFTACNSPQTYGDPVPLGEGPHTFDVRAVDPAGNVGPITSRTWLIDITVPTTTITDGPSGATASSVASFEFESNDATAGFECRLDGTGDWEECSSPQLYADVSDGSHTFEVRAADSAGNVDASPDSRTWTVDTTAPETTIVTSPQNPTALTSAGFTFTSPDDPNATFECNLDGAGWQGCNSPQNLTNLAPGQHTFKVRATDALNNTDQTPAHRTWTIDTTAPVATIDSGPQNPTASGNGTFQFSSDDPGATFECRVDFDIAGFHPCNSPEGATGLANGSHTFEVRAKDALNNTGPVDSYTWTVDTITPDVTIVSRTPAAATNSSTTATFQFSSTDGTATFECKLDGGNWQSCTTGKAYTGLDDGSHTFSVRSHDAVNHTSAPATDTWAVADSGPPNATIDSGPADGVATDAGFTFSVDESSSFQCKLDTEAFAACGGPGMNAAKSYTGLPVGTHTFTVRATDQDGNPDPSPPSWTWTVSAPPAAGGGGVQGQTAQSPTITPGRKLKHGRGTAATVSCPTGPCTVTGTGKIKIAGRSFRVRVKAATPLASGSAANVTIVLSKAARTALAAAGKGTLKLALSASSSGGTVTKNAKLKVTK